ncbi:phosphatase PAP2 family protein [Pseudonocardia sp. RS010]|uniref:phosphatase PAP2 family protein n=1 Tax=Pseudonocardia sp. RS010 TaxID=3385979 RepID=UPI0039A16016
MPGAAPAGRAALPGEHALAIAVAVSSLIAAITMALLLAGGSTPTRADSLVRTAVADVWSEPEPGALVVDWLGSPEALLAQTALVAVVCLAVNRLRIALVAGIAPWVVAAVTTGAKPLVARTIHEPWNLAFPSGHTAATTAVALVAGLLVADVLCVRSPGSRIVVALAFGFVGGGAMAAAQVALDAHYPSDCLGGFLTAIAAVFLMAVSVDRVVASRNQPAPEETRGGRAADRGGHDPGARPERDDGR